METWRIDADRNDPRAEAIGPGAGTKRRHASLQVVVKGDIHRT